MIFDFPSASGGIYGGDDESEVADCDISGCQCSYLCLFIDEGEDGEGGVGGSEEYEKEDTYFEGLEGRVHFGSTNMTSYIIYLLR